MVSPLGRRTWDHDYYALNNLEPYNANLTVGTATNPWKAGYFTTVYGNVVGEIQLDNNQFLTSLDLAGTGSIDLLKADATDNTVINAKTGKIGKLAIAGTTVGTWDANSIDFPAFNLTDGSDKNYNIEAYAAGTAYSLTAVSAALTFGTTQPAIVINKAGTYLLFASVNLKYNAATFAAVRAVTLKLRRTNNTAADITSSSTVLSTDIITTLTYTFARVALAPVLYTTAVLTDAITIFGDVAVVPTAGSLDAIEASLVAVRVY